MLKKITKRNGEVEEFIPSKLNKWIQWAQGDLAERVDWSGIVTEAVKNLGEETTSAKLQTMLIDLCIKKADWPHNLMAGRLFAANLHKKLYPNGIPKVKELHQKLIKKGLMVDLGYSDSDYEFIENNIIDHDRDFNLAQFQIKHINSKYSIQNRGSKKTYETPQFTYLRMAMALSQDFGDNKLAQVKSYYDDFSENALSAPTPNYVNLGTKLKGYASCCLFKSDDNIDSLAIGDYIAYKMTAQSAGLGSIINTRSIGDKVRGGAIEHQGKYLYTKSRAAASKANQQAGRGGAANEYYTAYDPEASMLARIQNPRTPVDKRNRDIHFTMISNTFFCQKVMKNEKVFTFTSHSAPDLWEAIFAKYPKVFEVLYLKYENDKSFKKNYISAREFILEAIQQSYEVGTHYLLNATEVNRHSPFIEPIYTSNLCVAPETKILTDSGYKEIHTLKDKEVNVWNGKEFSGVTIRKTSDNSHLIKIITDSGHELEVTEYHKFYIRSDNYHDKKEYEVCAKDLKIGDKLIKFDLPVIEGSLELPAIYDQFFIPDSDYSLKARLKWLGWLFDYIGCIDDGELIVSSGFKKVLFNLVLMLQTLGVNAKINFDQSLGLFKLVISNHGFRKLIELGLRSYRLKYIENNSSADAEFIKILDIVDNNRYSETYCFTEPKQHKGMFNGILTGQCVEIALPTQAYYNMIDLLSEKDNGYVTLKDSEGEYDFPYSDPIDGYYPDQRTFYGNLTNENVKDYGFDEVIKKVPTSEIALCSLFAVVLPKIKDDDHYRKVVRNGLLMIDWCIHNSDYPLAHVGWAAKQRLNAGIGIIGLATVLAEKGLTYDSQEGRNEIHRIAERHAYICIEQSLRLGIELGNAPWMHKTLWPKGWLPIDTYKKEVDSLVTVVLQYDWEGLRSRIISNGGIRNSSLIAHMPTEASSKAVGQPNGPYPIRFLNIKKSDQNNIIDWVAPDSDILKDKYQIAWDLSIEDQIKFYSIIQKFTDQSISADFYSDRTNGDLLSIDLITDYITMFKYGMKSRYYMNSLVAVNESTQKEEVCTSGTCDV